MAVHQTIKYPRPRGIRDGPGNTRRRTRLLDIHDLIVNELRMSVKQHSRGDGVPADQTGEQTRTGKDCRRGSDHARHCAWRAGEINNRERNHEISLYYQVSD